MKRILISALIPGIAALSLFSSDTLATERDANLLELCRQQAKLNEVDKEDTAAYIEECLQDAQDSDITEQNPVPSKEKEG